MSLRSLHHLALIGADDDLTVTADQERMADAAEVYRVDDLHQRLQAQVTTDTPSNSPFFFTGMMVTICPPTAAM